MNKEQSSYLYMPGATTVGVVCKNGVILASEKRITYGNLVLSRSGKKVFKITDNIGVACAGLISDMQVLVREIVAYTNLFKLELGRSISVKATAKMVSNLLFNNRFAPLITQTIVAGIDGEGPTLYVLDVMGSNIPDRYTSVGSGAEIAIGILEQAYKEEISIAQGRDLVVKAVKSALKRDAMSGDGIDLLIITREGIKEETVQI